MKRRREIGPAARQWQWTVRHACGVKGRGLRGVGSGARPSMHFFGELTCRIFLLPSLFGGVELGSVERRVARVKGSRD